jgi:hypothetical protein
MPEDTTAAEVAKRAEQASLGGPIGMAGGGIVALQAGGNPPQPAPSTPAGRFLQEQQRAAQERNELSRLRRQARKDYGLPSGIGGLFVEQTDEEREFAKRAQESINRLSKPELEQLIQSGVLPTGAAPAPQVETIGEQGAAPVQAPPENIGDKPPVSSESVGLDQLRDRGQQQQQMTPANRGSNLGATFEEFRKMIPKGEMSPEQTALLDDMRSRLEQKTAKAGDQEDKSKYEAIMLAGLAMMGGTSLADGIARAAQVGGATYMSSKKEARKALNDAENAELAFRQYQLEVMKGNDKEAQGQFDTFLNFTAKMADVDAKYAMAGATNDERTEQRIRTAINQDKRLANAQKQIDTAVLPKDKIAAEQNYNRVYQQVADEVRKGFGRNAPADGGNRVKYDAQGNRI